MGRERTRLPQGRLLGLEHRRPPLISREWSAFCGIGVPPATKVGETLAPHAETGVALRAWQFPLFGSVVHEFGARQPLGNLFLSKLF
jgi:hypothetical protein